MPERSFGRTVRYRRTKLGLSQAKLGELVGRSSSTIRSWERDKSTPTEPAVLQALAAVLGVEVNQLFEKAGQDPPLHLETSPTLEEALASLRPAAENEGKEEADMEPVDEDDVDEDPGEQGTDVDEQDASLPVREHATVGRAGPGLRPGYVKPPEPFVITPPSPPYVEPSYMEDQGQRQIYRVRNLATLVVVVALVIALTWALSQSLDAFGVWWDDFFGSLRL